MKQPTRINSKCLIPAAVVLLLVISGFYACNDNPAKPAATLVWQEYSTTNEVKNIRLPDRSTVWLNAGSSIRFDSAFGKREIWLQGEAYFDVASVDGQPFEVHTANIITRALGTAFNIDAYTPADRIAIIVRKGKVSVNDSTHQLDTLLPNQRMICKTDGAFKKDTATADNYMAWTSGEYVFHQMKFSEVAKRLERKFGVILTFKDAGIGDCHITASFTHTATLKDILEMLARTNGSTIEKGENPDQYFISGKKQCK